MNDIIYSLNTVTFSANVSCTFVWIRNIKLKTNKMKKSLLILTTVLGMKVLVAQTNTPVGSEVNGANPPTIVTSKFQTDYPNINAKWIADGDNFSAEYRNQNTNMGTNVIYDRYGNMVSTNIETNKDEYPNLIGDYYIKNHPNEEYKIWSSEDSKGNKTYYSKGKSRTIWFDKDGKYIQKKVKTTKKTNK